MKQTLFEGFSWEGSVDVARRELSARRRVLLLRFGAMGAVLLAVALLIIWIMTKQVTMPQLTADASSEAEIANFHRQITRGTGTVVAIFYYFLCGLFAMLSASTMFSELSTKEGRISLLMTPESITDKFTGRFLVYVVGFAVTFLVTSVVAVLLAGLLGNLMFGDVIEFRYLTNPITNIFDDTFNSALLLFPLTLVLIANASFFVTGSVAFPRYTFLKTYAVTVVVQIILQTIFAFAAILPIFVGYGMDVDMRDGAFTWISVIACVLLAVLTLFNWCMGLYWLRHTDVIDS